MLEMAFYKAPGALGDRLIRMVSGRIVGGLYSPAIYSHVEYVLERSGTLATCISASRRDGFKVRQKDIQLKASHWDLVTLPGNADAADSCAKSLLELRYDLIGAALSITPFWWTRKGYIFCSWAMGEIANAAGASIEDPHKLTPQELYDRVTPAFAPIGT